MTVAEIIQRLTMWKADFSAIADAAPEIRIHFAAGDVLLGGYSFDVKGYDRARVHRFEMLAGQLGRVIDKWGPEVCPDRILQAFAPDDMFFALLFELPRGHKELEPQVSEVIHTSSLNRAPEAAVTVIDMLLDYAYQQAEEGASALSQNGPLFTASTDRSHAEDFTSVMWYGKRYEFTPGAQAESIRALWQAFENGGHSLNQETIAAKVDSQNKKFRLRVVFRGHPALGTMIKSPRKGVFLLAAPDSR